jgi:hypothetical protein
MVDFTFFCGNKPEPRASGFSFSPFFTKIHYTITCPACGAYWCPRCDTGINEVYTTKVRWKTETVYTRWVLRYCPVCYRLITMSQLWEKRITRAPKLMDFVENKHGE